MKTILGTVAALVLMVSCGSQSSVEKMLDKYEKCVDEYVETFKKVKDGDASATAEYATLLEETHELAAELEKVADKMTEAERSRFMEISAKIAGVAEF